MKRKARDRSASVMRLESRGKESECVDAKRCFARPSGTTSVHMNKKGIATRVCVGFILVATSRGRVPVTSRKRYLFAETHDKEK